jgi:TrmH family RNA methyltransferase
MHHPDSTITSTSNEKMKRLRALAMKKHRDAEGVFIVEGAEHVQKALAHGWQVETLLFTSGAKNKSAAQAIIKTCRSQNAALYEVTDKVASYVTHRDNAQALIGVFRQKYHSMEMIKPGSGGLWLGLENIRDPGNLGTIIRTADAVGVQGILLLGNTCDAFSPEVIRATTGSFSAVPLMQVPVPGFLAWRKQFRGSVIGTHLYKNSVDYRALPLTLPAIVLMGGEQDGLSPELSDACDVLAKIPMREGVESLNLAVSTAIMLYELRKAAS